MQKHKNSLIVQKRFRELIEKRRNFAKLLQV